LARQAAALAGFCAGFLGLGAGAMVTRSTLALP
jgi:hypothetical protein